MQARFVEDERGAGGELRRFLHVVDVARSLLIVALLGCGNTDIDLFGDGRDGDGAAAPVVARPDAAEEAAPASPFDASGTPDESATNPATDAQGLMGSGLDSAALQRETGGAACVADSDCLDTAQAHCDQRLNACVQCLTDSHCAGKPESKCDRVTETCGLPCTSSRDCAATHQTCDTAQGVCAECLSDAQCSGQTPRCDMQQRECVQCLSLSDCSSPMKCWQQVCVACVINSDCTESGACSASHECN
ncbi:MAG: hypothetical protein M3O50_07720 [Myxococcota bacterium]|nr:hypothetical protein [Myxococcota bacterium]